MESAISMWIFKINHGISISYQYHSWFETNFISMNIQYQSWYFNINHDIHEISYITLNISISIMVSMTSTISLWIFTINHDISILIMISIKSTIFIYIYTSIWIFNINHNFSRSIITSTIYETWFDWKGAFIPTLAKLGVS